MKVKVVTRFMLSGELGKNYVFKDSRRKSENVRKTRGILLKLEECMQISSLVPNRQLLTIAKSFWSFQVFLILLFLFEKAVDHTAKVCRMCMNPLSKKITFKMLIFYTKMSTNLA